MEKQLKSLEHGKVRIGRSRKEHLQSVCGNTYKIHDIGNENMIIVAHRRSVQNVRLILQGFKKMFHRIYKISPSVF